MAGWFSELGVDWDKERGITVWCIDTDACYYAHYFPPGYQPELLPLCVSDGDRRVV